MQTTINSVCQYNVAVLLIPSEQLFSISNDIPYSLVVVVVVVVGLVVVDLVESVSKLIDLIVDICFQTFGHDSMRTMAIMDLGYSELQSSFSSSVVG